MAILVTGGAGFIGSHTCVELLLTGYEIVIVDNFSNSKPEALNRIKEITNRPFVFYNANLLDKQALERIFSENQIQAVIHFAGLKSVRDSVSIPIQYYLNNISGSLLLFEVMKAYNVKKIVFSSSATVYGESVNIPVTEETPRSAINPYGRTKLIIEYILEDIYISDPQWSVALLRYFNPIGAHESGRIGEDPNDIPNNLMPFITQVAVKKRDRLHIFGGDYNTHDGTGIRDYIHVVDLARGHINALKKIISSNGVNAYNLGTGKGHSVLDVVNAFEKETGQHIPFTITARRTGDIAAYYADPSRAEKELNWVARKTIEDMCRDAWRWQMNNPHGYE